MRRTLIKLLMWIDKNKPSGTVSVFMTLFIVSYILIVRLDSDRRVFTQQNHTSYVHEVSKALRTNASVIPKEILEDFAKDAKDESKTATTEDYMNIRDTKAAENLTVEETTELILMSENEDLLNSELENQEEEIDKNWGSYLNRNSNNVGFGKFNQKVLKSQSHLNFQGIFDKNRTRKGSIFDAVKHLPKSVQVFDAFKEPQELRNSISTNKCVLLKTLHGDSPICIHDPELDESISGFVFEHGTWEPNYVYTTGSILKMHSDLLFLDLGCNIGVYTILAARLGRTVVSIDPNKRNLRLLTKSLSLGNIKDDILLLWNAVSDVHENVTINEIVGNVGGTFVDSAKVSDKDPDSELAITITLDDLIGLTRGKPVFIKMDIETYEWKALKGGKDFFKRVDVQFVLMEWIYHREAESGPDIIKFMAKNGLYAHVNNHHNTRLEPKNYHNWPDNVFWIKY